MGKRAAVVVGAGPVGALAAIALAQRGWGVQVFEKRPAPERKPAPGNTQAYQLSLNGRGLSALKAAGVDYAPLAALHNGLLEQIFYNAAGGEVMKHQMKITPHDAPNLRVFRDELAWLLVAEARRLHADAIAFTFNAAVEAVDFESRSLQLTSRGQTREVAYELLVGADGAGSVVRQQLQATLPLGFVSRIRHDIVYTGVSYDSRARGECPAHAYFHTHFFSAGAVTASGYADSSTRLMLFTNEQAAELLQKGEAQWLQDGLARELPVLPPGAKEALRQLAASRPGFHRMAGWTTLAQLHGPQVALVGDAAHTVTPVLGQGCNAGLEDVAVLCRQLDACGGQVDAALPAYTAARLPDVRALVQMNQIAAQERAAIQRTGAAWRHQAWLAVHGLLLKGHTALHRTLHGLAPGLFRRPAFTRAVIGEASYREGIRGLYWDLAALLAFLAAILVPLLARLGQRN